jgi:hypothetical protein
MVQEGSLLSGRMCSACSLKAVVAEFVRVLNLAETTCNPAEHSRISGTGLMKTHNPAGQMIVYHSQASRHPITGHSPAGTMIVHHNRASRHLITGRNPAGTMIVHHNQASRHQTTGHSPAGTMIVHHNQASRHPITGRNPAGTMIVHHSPASQLRIADHNQAAEMIMLRTIDAICNPAVMIIVWITGVSTSRNHSHSLVRKSGHLRLHSSHSRVLAFSNATMLVSKVVQEDNFHNTYKVQMPRNRGICTLYTPCIVT